MLSSTTTPLSYHHFPIFAFDHSIVLHRFAPILHRFAPFCTVLLVLLVLPVLQGPGGEWVSVVAVSLQACASSGGCKAGAVNSVQGNCDRMRDRCRCVRGRSCVRMRRSEGKQGSLSCVVRLVGGREGGRRLSGGRKDVEGVWGLWRVIGRRH